MSSGLARVAKTGREGFAQVEKAVKNVQKSVDGLKKHNDILGTTFDGLKIKAKQLEQAIATSNSASHIRLARRELALLQKDMNNHPGNMTGKTKGTNMMGGLLRRFAPAVIGAAALSLSSAAAAKAIEFEGTKKSFEVLTGNKKTGNGLANELNTLQRDTILGPEVFKSAQTLLAFGVATDKVMPSIKMLGDVSMGNAEKFNSLTLAFAQTASAGKLTGQDLLQYVNAGFNPLNEIAKATGKSMGYLRKEMEKGNITSAMVVKAFESATGVGGKFNDMMNQMAETSGGKLAQANGKMESAMIRLGEKTKWLTVAFAELKAGYLNVLLGQEKLSTGIIDEKSGVNTLIATITSLNEKNDVRSALLKDLVKQYPDLFSGIDKEKIKNGELLAMLNDINTAYDKRINMAISTDNRNKLEEDVTNNFNSLKFSTRVAQEKGGGRYWELRLNRERSLYENSVAELNRAKKVEEAGSIMKRIESVEAFGKDPAKLGSLGKNKGVFLDVINTWKSKGFNSGMGMGTLQNMETLMNSVSAKNIPTSGGESSASTKGGRSIGSSITGGGPRVINIHGVKFMDKMENHFSSFKEGKEEMQAQLEDMFLRILNSGAAVQ